MRVQITRIAPQDRPPSESGTRLLATFDCELYESIRLQGCTLIRKRNGQALALAPKIDGSLQNERSIKIIDHSLRVEMQQAAIKALSESVNQSPS